MSLDSRLTVRRWPGVLVPRPAAWQLAVPGALVLGTAVAALPIEVAAGLTLALLLLGLALVEPRAGLAALLVAVPLSTVVTVEAGDFSVTLIEPLMVLLTVAWAARGVARRDLRLEPGALLPALGLVLLAVLLSSLAAERVGLAYKETVKWLELLVVYAFTATHLRDASATQRLLAVLLLAGAGEALFGVAQYATGEGPSAFTIGEALRAYGHFEQPNPFAGYLGTVFPLAGALAAHGRPAWLARLAAAAAALTGLGILLSLSRGAWVGVAFGCALMLWFWGRAGRRWLALGAVGLVGLILLTATGLLPGGWSDRLVAVLENFGIFDVRTVEVTGENFAVVERMAHWQAGWYMLLDHPVVGVGAGNYPAVYDQYALPGWPEALGHAHNYYLNMAAEAGLLGAVALLCLVVAAFRSILRGLRSRAEGSFGRALLAGLLASFAVLSVHNLFDNLLVHGMQVQLGFLLGLVAAWSESDRAAREPIGPAA